MHQNYERNDQSELFEVQSQYNQFDKLCYLIIGSDILNRNMSIECYLQEEILNGENITDAQRGSFMRPEKLHITFGVMRLPTGESQSQAKQILTECVEKIIK